MTTPGLRTDAVTVAAEVIGLVSAAVSVRAPVTLAADVELAAISPLGPAPPAAGTSSTAVVAQFWVGADMPIDLAPIEPALR